MAEKTKLGRTLVIANPVSQSGKGREAAEFVDRFLQSFSNATTAYKMVMTSGPGDATGIAAKAQGYDTVIAIGGDGIIHETVNGLMKIKAGSRPAFGVIPIGSGNDYARTLHLALNDPTASLGQVLNGTRMMLDLGLCNGVYFCETLSFGLDAAIALDTMERRKRTGAHGTRLFAESGYDIFRSYTHGWKYTASLDGGKRFSGEEIAFACQVGPTYGGGFKICPEASPVDGKLDLCYNTRMPSKPAALALFARTRLGLHCSSPTVKIETFKHLNVTFDEEPPVQIDGEKMTGRRFEVSVQPQALEVIVPNSFPWNPNRVEPEKLRPMDGLLGTKLSEKVRGE
ncbi:diacylglycerol kinase family lipid kinase [Olsenella sp. YH-ols2217]|uniref:Diacylglycerol kinase family lipid kinase n=1 Tax=Kribbibacterium absianum TaxID=3044210 RepID=A0ABT6ZHJ1_9ACTN|nr:MULTISPECIES: diacylglycerol kinase family protein [unclassified Olsenella]MDJ1121030.1 diacylglycerol kinase family lipid kinase [Olsenella sp. YH-ols2216]MDJ1128521.1 diacylglycerol kinase family lipid kinase [Olsenella sp. YH-ols2217]